MANGGATAEHEHKRCRGFNGLVAANGGARGAENRRVRSPAGGEANGLGGVDHRRLKAALGGEEGTDGERDGELGHE